VGAGARLPDAGGRLLGAEGGPLDALDAGGAGASGTGAETLGCAQTALPGAPEADPEQPAADRTPLPASMTISANNPREPVLAGTDAGMGPHGQVEELRRPAVILLRGQQIR
jgi:hypothetical protein